MQRPGFDPWVRKIPWRREWLPTQVFLPRESHEQRSLAGYSLWVARVRHNLATKPPYQFFLELFVPNFPQFPVMTYLEIFIVSGWPLPTAI